MPLPGSTAPISTFLPPDVGLTARIGSTRGPPAASLTRTFGPTRGRGSCNVTCAASRSGHRTLVDSNNGLPRFGAVTPMTHRPVCLPDPGSRRSGPGEYRCVIALRSRHSCAVSGMNQTVSGRRAESGPARRRALRCAVVNSRPARVGRQSAVRCSILVRNDLRRRRLTGNSVPSSRIASNPPSRACRTPATRSRLTSEERWMRAKPDPASRRSIRLSDWRTR